MTAAELEALKAKENPTGAERRRLRRELTGALSGQEVKLADREGAMKRFFGFLKRVSTVALPSAEMRQEQKAATRARLAPTLVPKAQAKRERRAAARVK